MADRFIKLPTRNSLNNIIINSLNKISVLLAKALQFIVVIVVPCLSFEALQFIQHLWINQEYKHIFSYLCLSLQCGLLACGFARKVFTQVLFLSCMIHVSSTASFLVCFLWFISRRQYLRLYWVERSDKW
jgi:hypothetical protein